MLHGRKMDSFEEDPSLRLKKISRAGLKRNVGGRRGAAVKF